MRCDINSHAKGYAAMIFQPKIGQTVKINYKDKSMRFQSAVGVIASVGIGKGPKNVLILTLAWKYVVVPRGNLVAI